MRKALTAAALVFGLAAAPAFADIARDTAACSESTGSADRVIEACTGVIASAEPSAEIKFKAYMQRAAAHFTGKADYDRAVADVTEAIKLRPADPAGHAFRGAIHLSFNEYEKAIADLSEAIRLAPADANALASRAFAYVQTGQDEKAIADYSEVVRLNPADANALYDRGGTYEKMKDFDKARADYEQAIKLQRDYAGEFPDTCFATGASGERTLANWPACDAED